MSATLHKLLMDSPVEQATQSARQQRNRQAGRQTKENHAQRGAGQTTEDDGFAANAIAQTSPGHGGRELGKGKGRSDEAGVDGDARFIVGDVEVANHEIDVGEDGHEGNGFANATCACEMSLVFIS